MINKKNLFSSFISSFYFRSCHLQNLKLLEKLLMNLQITQKLERLMDLQHRIRLEHQVTSNKESH